MEEEEAKGEAFSQEIENCTRLETSMEASTVCNCKLENVNCAPNNICIRESKL